MRSSSIALPVVALSLLCASCVPERGAHALSAADALSKGGALPGGEGSAEAVEARIRRIEGGLLPATVTEGEAAPEMRIEARLAYYDVPGVSVAVIHGDRIEWAKSYGVTDRGGTQPVTPETMFQACSVSKPIAAMAALHWVQEGKLELDEDVNVRLTSWQVPASPLTATSKVTVRRILSHSAGLTVHGFAGYEPGEELPTLVQILDGQGPASSAAIRVDLEPGTQYRYSGGGYSVLQQLLGDVLRKPFGRILQETVLAPLAMEHSTFDQPLPERLARTAAAGHAGDGNKIHGNWHVYPELAAAGLWTTPSDLARFALEIQRARRGAGRVLSREMVEQMLTPQLNGFGLGLAIAGKGANKRFSHSGSNAGYKSMLVAGRDDLGVMVMTNGERGHALIEEIARAVAKEYGLPGFEVKRQAKKQ